jgi:hypothetical protein
MPTHTEPLTGLWLFYLVCALLAAWMWLANQPPKGS